MALQPCRECGESVSTEAPACPHCGVPKPAGATRQPSDTYDTVVPGCIGLLLGPVGLWYKGHWAAGFAWLAVAIIVGVATGGMAVPFLWVGMAIHAAMAEPRY